MGSYFRPEIRDDELVSGGVGTDWDCGRKENCKSNASFVVYSTSFYSSLRGSLIFHEGWKRVARDLLFAASPESARAPQTKKTYSALPPPSNCASRRFPTELLQLPGVNSGGGARKGRSGAPNFNGQSIRPG